ncbi:CPBP family intramembrane metalloprotease [Corynebacterium breve]|uniref:CPBP family intramembrane metalloprotease n=1 Tax=Corynebacterium breve TaxID=3049799 RepID=A0ABY8VIT2_9CORY|nr:CPBP family intramembrane glutamic endopeptidase [Corynebacterium breve]WIM68528.1 CPBP family intramembrane metalloprotease [Corynebacterium breve]
MVELLLLSIPTIAYIVFMTTKRSLPRSQALKNTGITSGTPISYLWAVAILLGICALTWVLSFFIDSHLLDQPGVVVGHATSIIAVVGVIFRAFGEEIFFRGFLGGLLVRRFGFTLGNFFQAVIFFLPHLMLLAVSVQVWPLLILQFISGWLLGWLRHVSGSVLPAGLVHSATNLLAPLFLA